MNHDMQWLDKLQKRVLMLIHELTMYRMIKAKMHRQQENSEASLNKLQAIKRGLILDSLDRRLEELEKKMGS